MKIDKQKLDPRTVRAITNHWLLRLRGISRLRGLDRYTLNTFLLGMWHPSEFLK